MDPNTGQRMYESNDIIRYLFETYGDGNVAKGVAPGPLTIASSMLASWTRGLGGSLARPSRAPEKPLELWSFEASPYCRIVRETLCRLELPYLRRGDVRVRRHPRLPAEDVRHSRRVSTSVHTALTRRTVREWAL